MKAKSKLKSKKIPKPLRIKYFMIRKFPCKMPVLHELSSDNLILPAVQIYLPLLSSPTPTVPYRLTSLEKVRL